MVNWNWMWGMFGLWGILTRAGTGSGVSLLGSAIVSLVVTLLLSGLAYLAYSGYKHLRGRGRRLQERRQGKARQANTG